MQHDFKAIARRELTLLWQEFVKFLKAFLVVMVIAIVLLVFTHGLH